MHSGLYNFISMLMLRIYYIYWLFFKRFAQAMCWLSASFSHPFINSCY